MTGREVVRVLGQRYSLDIIEACDEPMTASQLSDRLDIPIATAYRRVEDLTDADLLERQGQIQDSPGRSAAAYRRSVAGMEVAFGQETTVRLEPRSTVPEQLDAAWQKLLGKI